jgi:sulfotransferase family protein
VLSLVSARGTSFIDAPLVVISQIFRSGGSMLAQLFDGHSQVYAHPAEIRIGHPDSRGDWPVLDPAGDPEEWFRVLRSDKWTRFARNGFGKAGRNRFAQEQRHIFTFDESEQRSCFLELVELRSITRPRDILDCWFTSFFASWREWQPTGREVVITGFRPRMVMRPDSMEGFRADYPDGKLITIVRDPRSWYASSRVTHYTSDEEMPEAVDAWTSYARGVAQLLGSRVPWALGLTFDDLVLNPERTMQRVASFVGIEFDPCLLQPSYAGRPILPNSSFSVPEYGINPEMARRVGQISDEAQEAIAAEALPLYESLTELLAAPAGSVASG